MEVSGWMKTANPLAELALSKNQVFKIKYSKQPIIKKLMKNDQRFKSNKYVFRWPTNEPCTTTHLRKIFRDLKKVTSIEDDMKITSYSARIG